MSQRIELVRAFGESVEGVALVSEEGFSPRYDLDRETGVISRPGHSIEGESITGRVLFFPTAKGGIAAGWAFYDLVGKGIAPKAIVFGVANPVMVQGAIFAGIPVAEGPDALDRIESEDEVRLVPEERCLEILGRG